MDKRSQLNQIMAKGLQQLMYKMYGTNYKHTCTCLMILYMLLQLGSYSRDHSYMVPRHTQMN